MLVLATLVLATLILATLILATLSPEPRSRRIE
jgi:hypothetical protein